MSRKSKKKNRILDMLILTMQVIILIVNLRLLKHVMRIDSKKAGRDN